MTGASIIDLAATRQRKLSQTARIGVVIQARMTSKRFPGKSMATFDGKPVLQHVIERCKLIRGPNSMRLKNPIQVIVAVPDTPESEVMLELAASLGVENSCADEDNVLRRYYVTAKFFKLDYIVRITADCPLIDPTVCSEVLQLLMWRKVDFASNCHEQRSYPKGLDCEAFTFDTLEVANFIVAEELKQADIKMDSERAKDALYMQEHVTTWMIREPEVKKALVKQNKDMSKLNWCIDYPEDIQRLEEMLKKKRAKEKAKILEYTPLIYPKGGHERLQSGLLMPVIEVSVSATA